MRTEAIAPSDLRAVFPVPPLARRHDATRSIHWSENDRILRHMRSGGMDRFLYGGNAFLYHVSLAEYEELLDWLSGADDSLWMIPSAGSSFGRLLDQAAILRRYKFPCVMALPSGDPLDAIGLETGLREFADRSGTPLVVYLKNEANFGSDREAGLDAVARLVGDGVCVAIKYAVVRRDPAVDPYLQALLERVDRARVISGIGERPAVVHMRDWGLPGFTTGSGCIAPATSLGVFRTCVEHDYAAARRFREWFLPLEDLRDAWGPARVLHEATELAGIASTGPAPPFISRLSENARTQLRPIAQVLKDSV
ncbi:MAG TPA: dihydrodipicolinate synthase family protein [Bryobacteraceae bacterium]|nr:dihydrodipicolinate synthase family protein [Bryobacteraceae bacterium]